jgi:quercetin dioxygenase-like cupin family protein
MLSLAAMNRVLRDLGQSLSSGLICPPFSRRSSASASREVASCLSVVAESDVWSGPTTGRLPQGHEEIDMRRVSLVAVVLVLVVSVVPAMAQDAVKVDSKHYKMEFENDQVRVLRITYAPHEKSVMHEHPANVAVFLTDGQGKFTLPDGKTQDAPFKAGTAQWDGGGKHLPENVGDKPFELVLVELKTKPATAK